MTWATRADLEARFGIQPIADLELGGVSVSESLLDAEAEAAGWIGRAVSLPLAVVPDTVKRIVCTISRYNLWRRDLPEDHPVYIAYRDAVRELGDIAAGRIVLPATGGTAETVTNGGAVVIASDRVFNDALMRGTVL